MADLDSSILLAFLEADGEPVSGDRLAKELGVSRVAIWSRLERLRASGYVFAASTRKGYALRSVPRHLDPALLDAHLRLLKVSPKVEFLAEVDSTNSEAERRLAVGQEAPFAVLARTQKAGRGRLGRKWHSAPSGNLYLSLAFRPFIPPERLKPFTLWMGLALCAHVEKSLGLKLGLKWPNDLQSPDGRKVAGMLTEARLDDGELIGALLVLGERLRERLARNSVHRHGPEVAALQQLRGVLTRSVRDTAAFVDHCRGGAPGEFMPYWTPAEPYSQLIQRDPGRLRIALSHEWGDYHAVPHYVAELERVGRFIVEL